MPLTMELVREARRFLEGRVRRTPVEESPGLSERLGVPVWLKLECVQVTGSFKVRGAFFRMSRLTGEERRRGVATCSAGNHGKAVAYVARALGVSARVYVPASVEASRRRAIAALGAEVVVSEFPGYDETEAWAMEETARLGKVWVSAFDDEAIMAGNGGTVAAEVLEDVPSARTFLLPVGGGGLSGGFTFYAKEVLPDARVVGCQHVLSPALALSLERGEAVTRLAAAETTAGGLEGGIGRSTFEVLKTRIDGVALLSEEEIFEGVRWMLEEHQCLIEPSSAVTVAACLAGRVGKAAGPAAVVISGRNVGMETLRRILG